MVEYTKKKNILNFRIGIGECISVWGVEEMRSSLVEIVKLGQDATFSRAAVSRVNNAFH